jgi:integrase
VKELPDDSAIHDRYLKPTELESLLAHAISQRELNLPVVGLQFVDFPEFITLAVHTGLRMTELLMLEFPDVDFENAILSVKKKPHLKFLMKNYQERHVKMNNDALVALLSMKQRKHSVSDFVFHTADGSAWKKHARGFLEGNAPGFLLRSLLSEVEQNLVSCYAERGTRTPTPLRALEPESSASANSAISAKALKSMFFAG